MILVFITFKIIMYKLDTKLYFFYTDFCCNIKLLFINSYKNIRKIFLETVIY